MSIAIESVSLDKISFIDFKGLILLKGKDLKEWCKDLGLKKNPKIREICFKQIKDGEGMKLYYDALKAEVTGDQEEEDFDE